MLVRFKKDVVDEKADCVVILAGINDLAENNGPITLDQIFENIKSMVKIANNNNINVILSSILLGQEMEPQFSRLFMVVLIN